jgi:hypothetical protein
LDGDLFTLEIDNPIIIYASDVINLLNAYKNRTITIEHLLDWVNTIWFTELFTYNDNQCDSIADVLNRLEELDEDGSELKESDIDNYIHALKNNREI